MAFNKTNPKQELINSSGAIGMTNGKHWMQFGIVV
jgi:hypothetical protein